MPRGPGKKENYNFDYSRFNGLDQQQQEQVNPQDAGVPDDIFRQLPGELQEAVRLMQIARQTGDQKAQERANELALKAVERGGPEMKQRFQQELMRQAAQNPEARQGVEAMLNSGSLNASHSPSTDKMMDLSSTIANLHTNMEAGARRAADQLENMQKQQEMLENLRGPEDFARFMAEQGLSQEDLQRALAGDESHMRNCIEKNLGQVRRPHGKKGTSEVGSDVGRRQRHPQDPDRQRHARYRSAAHFGAEARGALEARKAAGGGAREAGAGDPGAPGAVPEG